MNSRLILIGGIVGATALVLVAAIGGTQNAYAASNGACWGSATQDFAHTGTLGDHASQQDTPRTGLGNLMQLFSDGFAGLVFFLTGQGC